ncbi:hypothetical protein VC83_05193 [Pseudogymnoascus destructans]|uniref:Uncharacterized protein n=1 Tax=Pseudogymnoascus destructans TaxID=655981 RepID=A0A177A7A8_9PEZI|nr:uncharacterized protein VC83_05193 [Pseudogymnoascus destructans]OAF58045.1 hypothetical protein VC83_05193 [Pseudogymnoascus destructans]
MTIQSHEGGVILLAEKCLFPIRNDGNSSEDAPKKRWGVTKLSSCTLRKAGILRSCSCSACENQTSSLEQKDLLYFLATVWALLLWEFAEVDTVQIGVHNIFSSSAGSVKKQHMRLLATSRSQTKTVNELFKAEGWSVYNMDERHYPYLIRGLYFNMVRKMRLNGLPKGEQGEEVCLHLSLPNMSLVKKNDRMKNSFLQICDITLVLDIDQNECFLVYKTTVT